MVVAKPPSYLRQGSTQLFALRSKGRKDHVQAVQAYEGDKISGNPPEGFATLCMNARELMYCWASFLPRGN